MNINGSKIFQHKINESLSQMGKYYEISSTHTFSGLVAEVSHITNVKSKAYVLSSLNILILLLI